MEKTAVLEITNSAVRLLVGELDANNKPVVLCVQERPIDGLVARGEIVDEASLSKVISSLKSFNDGKYDYDIKDVTLIIPPIGLKVLQGDESTNTGSANSIVSLTDVENVIYQIRKEKVSDDSVIVDIIPDVFVLDEQVQSLEPPMNQRADRVRLYAKVQTVLSRICVTYKGVVESAGLKVKRTVVSPYAISEYIKEAKVYPQTYILINFGAALTNVVLVSKNTLVSSTSVQYGGNDIILKVMDELQISISEAKDILYRYGITDREINFNPTIANGTSYDGKQIKCSPNDLNAIIESSLIDGFVSVDNALNSIISPFSDKAKNLPIIISGGFSDISGLKDKLEKHFESTNEVSFARSDVIGARGSKYIALLGALLISNIYRASLTDILIKK